MKPNRPLSLLFIIYTLTSVMLIGLLIIAEGMAIKIAGTAMVGLLAGCAWLYRRYCRKDHKKVQQEMMVQILHILQMRRHDDLNHMQILYGYFKLNKPDKVIPYIEGIKSKQLQESLISKLGSMELEWYFYRLEAGYPHLHIELGIEPDTEGNAHIWAKPALALCEWFKRMEPHIAAGSGREMNLRVRLSMEDETAIVEVELDGIVQWHDMVEDLHGWHQEMQRYSRAAELHLTAEQVEERVEVSMRWPYESRHACRDSKIEER